ncbi:aspartate 1-decarboxylase, partial [Streptomyces sp. SID11233]|nr:aspartate 1-decarboxylase [Streptomyces sp. SID11233]
PRVVHVDAGNKIVALGSDPSAPVPGTASRRSPRAVPGPAHV